MTRTSPWHIPSSRLRIQGSIVPALALGLAVILLLGGATIFPSNSHPASETPRVTQVGSNPPSQPRPPSNLDCGTFTAHLAITSPAIASGPAGSHLTVVGSGFFPTGPTTYIQIFLANYTGLYLDTLLFIPNGTAEPFTVNVTIPGVSIYSGIPVGTYYLWAGNDTPPANCADAAFTLTGIDPPDFACENWAPDLRVISPTPATGGEGTSVRLEGSGFNDLNDTPIFWTPVNATSYTLARNATTGLNATTNATGAFNITVDVPRGFTPGTYFFWATELGYVPYPCAGAQFNLTSGGPTLTLSPTSGPGDTNVTVTGTGFNASDTGVNITGKVLLFTLPCPLSAGSITEGCYFIVSGGVAGPHTISAVGNVVGGPADTATAAFTIFPTILLSPSNGSVGSSFTISGFDFSPGPAAADVTFDGQLLTPAGGPDCGAGSRDTLITPDALGQFDCNFTVPSWATPGANFVQGDDTNTSELTSNQTFTLNSVLMITSTPTIGPVGTSLTVTGSGFTTGQTIGPVQFGGVTVSCTGGAPVVISGAFTCTFNVPASGAGTYSVTAYDSLDLTVTTSNTFTVVPNFAITSSPLIGLPGTPITATGTGFTIAGGSMEIFIGVLPYENTPIACAGGTPEVSGSGTFTCSFDAPDIPYQTFGLIAFDPTDGSVASTNEFTIGVPPLQFLITSTPLTGLAGTPITVNGTGFDNPGRVETIIFDFPADQTPVNCTGGPPIVTVETTFTCTFDVPAIGFGTYTVTAFDPTDGQVTSNNEFTIAYPPIQFAITSSSLSGPVGTLITVNGTGFQNVGLVETIIFDFPADQTPINCASGTPIVYSLANFTCTFEVPTIAVGTYTVTAFDPTDGRVTSSNEFTVTQPYVESLSSPTVTPGLHLIFTVGGLADSTPYFVYLDTTQGVESGASYNPLGTFTSSSSGVLTGAVTVPSTTIPGKYYLDLFEDPVPAPYIFSVLNFTVGGVSAHSSLLGLSAQDLEIVAGIILVVVVGLVALALVRRRRKPEASSSDTPGPMPTGESRDEPS